MTKTVLFSRRNRNLAVGVGAALLVYGAVWLTFGGFQYSDNPLPPSERGLVLESAAPVIRAIRAFEADHKRPPRVLGDLVPHYLPQVPRLPSPPSTGRDYLYAVEPKQWRIGIPVRDERDGVLTYSSIRDYPPGKPGMPVERLGAWAYYRGNPF